MDIKPGGDLIGRLFSAQTSAYCVGSMPTTPGDAIMTTNLPFPVRRGKVRDVYDIAPERLLIVASDRISAFDCIMPNGIPDKGKVLTALARFWFRRFENQFEHHVLWERDD